MISAKQAKQITEMAVFNKQDAIEIQCKKMYDQIKNYYMKGIEKAVEKAMHEGKYEVEIPIGMNRYYEQIKDLMQNPLQDIITELADLGYTVRFRFPPPTPSELEHFCVHSPLNISWRYICNDNSK